MLVSNGAGGVVRRSGTSYAAPLVSGAITLLHDRWPWLTRYPHETVSIILRSARDLGEPGTDAVYGRGMLDVAASQSPLDFDALAFYEIVNGVPQARTAAQVRSGGVKSTWQADGAFFVLFETIGNTHRDFVVPMSSKLVGTVSINGGNQEQFQRFISSRMIDWIKTGHGFTDVATSTGATGDGWQMSFSAGASAQLGRSRLDMAESLASVHLSEPTGRFAVTLGSGNGATALSAQRGFGLTGDYGVTGGVNPLVGFASGGAFMKTDLALSTRTTLSLGVTSQSLRARDNIALSDTERRTLRDFDPYEAAAADVRITHRFSDRLTAHAAIARVREANGLLGVQSSAAEDLRHGSTSEAVTLGASLQLPTRFTLAASATAGRTRSASDQQGFRTDGAGIVTSAFALALTKEGVLGTSDKVRLSVAQPLHIERGAIAFQSVEVVDRSTGEIGSVDRSFDIASNKRRLTGEMLYATPLSGAAEGSLFGRVNLQSSKRDVVDDFVIGGRLSVGF